MIRTCTAPAVPALADAVQLLRAGELVAFPTETVYGLGADARSDAAVQKIYEAKGRPSGNPLIVHIASIENAKACTTVWPAIADKLAQHFWPGPLTLILPRGPALTPLVSAGRSTVAIRCPSHPVAQALLGAFNGPIAAPSANRSGFTSPTTAAHVYAELAGRIPLILDGGPCDIGLESTVLDISVNTPTILRSGAITLEMLRPFLPDVQLANPTIRPEDSAASPGLHSRHYAPRTAAYRFATKDWPLAQDWVQQHAPVALLSFDDMISLPAPHETIRMPAAETDYARLLYAALREADERRVQAILILLPESDAGLWSAIADRLRRATEPLPAFRT